MSENESHGQPEQGQPEEEKNEAEEILKEMKEGLEDMPLVNPEDLPPLPEIKDLPTNTARRRNTRRKDKK